MWVTIGSGEGKGLSVRVEGERFLVGTGAECRLMLGDPAASPLHAYFEVGESGRVTLHDLASEAGTIVDGERISGPRAIEGGEEIRIGDTLLTPTVADPAEEARHRAEAVGDHPEQAPAVRVTTEEGQTIEVVPAGDGGDDAGHPAVRVATEGEAVEVVPAGEHRRLRDRIRLATALAAGAALLAVAGVVVFLATRGDDDRGLATTREIVRDAKPRTVLIRTNLPGGRQAGGSGFVLDAGEGLVVTNYHVLNGGMEFFVGVDGDIRTATIVGAAPCDDLAVMKVEDTSGMKDFPMGSQSELAEGDPVVAVGYPANASLSDTLTSTAGVVSVAHGSFRAPPDADGPSYSNTVQTDAALNPGNSGGPLVDGHKRVVGVNAAVFTQAGAAPIQGQGYAIGIDRVKEVVKRLRTGKSNGWGGFGFAFPRGRGGRSPGAVAVPVPGSEAEKIGLRGALVTQINGAKVENYGTYCDAVNSVATGQTAVLTVVSKPGAVPRQVKLHFL